MDKHFVVTRVDVNRMTDGYKLMSAYGGDKAMTSPWFIFIDADGKRLAPAEDSKDLDIGFPTGDEIPQFVAMLRKAAPKLSDTEATAIETSLKAESEAIANGK
jgi:hypothetical protein